MGRTGSLTPSWVQGSPRVPRLQAALPREGRLTFQELIPVQTWRVTITNVQFIRKIIPSLPAEQGLHRAALRAWEPGRDGSPREMAQRSVLPPSSEQPPTPHGGRVPNCSITRAQSQLQTKGHLTSALDSLLRLSHMHSPSLVEFQKIPLVVCLFFFPLKHGLCITK